MSNAHKRPGFLGTITEEGYGAPIVGAEEGTADASEQSSKDKQSNEDSQTDD